MQSYAAALGGLWTLEDSVAGYMFNDLIWCRQEEEDGTSPHFSLCRSLFKGVHDTFFPPFLFSFLESLAQQTSTENFSGAGCSRCLVFFQTFVWQVLAGNALLCL